MRRLASDLCAVVALLALLVGAPLALAAWGRVGLLRGIDWAHAFSVRDDGRLLLGGLSLAGWAAWLVLVVAVVVEVAEVVDQLRAAQSRRPHRPVSLPGFDLPRMVVRGLVVTVVTAAFGLVLPRLHPAAVAQPVEVAAPAEPAAPTGSPEHAPTDQVRPLAPAPSRTSQKALPAATLHVVQPYDDLRALATRYYGDPSAWARIAEANSDLLKGQAVLRTGWRLVVPGVVGPDGTSVVVVAKGESLSLLAARYLGDGDRWPEIFALNRDIVDDPDQIDIGWRLRLPGSGAGTSAAHAGDTAGAGAAPVTTPPAQPEQPRPDPVPSTGTPVPAGTTVTTHAELPAPDEPEVPETAAPTVTAADEDDHDQLTVSQALALGVVGTVGAGLASAVVRTVHRRRDIQLALRPVGRRIPYPPTDAMRVESALTVLGVPSAVAPAVAPVTDQDEPTVVGPRRSLREPVYPAVAVVTAGLVADGPVTIDLERHGVTYLDLGDEEATWGAACAWALELACGRPDGGAAVVAVGRIGDVLDAAGLDAITHLPSVDAALTDLEAVVVTQRRQLASRAWSLGQARADADARDAWWPRVYVLPQLDPVQAGRLIAAVGSGPATAVSAVVLGGEASDPGAADDVCALVGTRASATLYPAGFSLTPATLTAGAAAGVVQLLGTSGAVDTLPAPWHASADDTTNVLPLHPRLAVATKEVVDVGGTPGVTDFSHPTLMLLGPIQLLGAAGLPPARAERACIEYCAWMIEHPGATASQMAAALLVAESTRRSNVSRLRGWLGLTPEGEPYLPEAYTGRLYVNATVSSDWQRLQLLVSPGINRVPLPTLVAALRLVRGAPLADAAPGQWHWAEELRTDMASLIRDIGAQVSESALADGDIDLARWATSRALTASPGDELLVRLRLRTEHRAGNRPEVERLVLQLTRHARVLGIDLDDETVLAIQEAIEGHPRARA